MVINSSTAPGSQGITPGNVKKKDDTQNAEPKEGTAQDAGALNKDNTGVTASTAPKTPKKDVNAGNGKDIKVRNPQLDMDIHYSIGRSGSSDKVTISGKAKDINAIKNAIAKLPDVREDKVKKYRDAIDEDEYDVDSNAVAGRMMDEI